MTVLSERTKHKTGTLRSIKIRGRVQEKMLDGWQKALLAKQMEEWPSFIESKK